MIIDVANAFIDRDSLTVSDEVLLRIQSAYKKSKIDQANFGDIYQVSREWIPIYQKYMSEYIEIMLGSDLVAIRKILNNFFRHPCSTGLHGMHFDMVDKYMNGPVDPKDLTEYINHCALYFNLFLKNCRPVDPRVLRRPLAGNPYGYELIESNERIFIYGGAEYHYSYARILEKLSPKSGKIFELGGGFGGLASFLLRSKKIKTYIGMDLPENAALQAYFLASLYPEKRMALYGEIDCIDNNWNNLDCDYIILPNYCIASLPENFADISFNSYSLAEMSKESIDNYLYEICRFTNCIFYHVNHTHWMISADDFNIDPEKFDLTFRFPTMWGKDPLRPNIDHHDFIYTRKNRHN